MIPQHPAPPTSEPIFEGKDHRGKEILLKIGSMGLQVQQSGKKSNAVPKTYLYQSLQGWQSLSGGHSFTFEMASGEAIVFAIPSAEGEQISDAITKATRKLAEAQRQALQAAQQNVVSAQDVIAEGSESEELSTSSR